MVPSQPVLFEYLDLVGVQTWQNQCVKEQVNIVVEVVET